MHNEKYPYRHTVSHNIQSRRHQTHPRPSQVWHDSFISLTCLIRRCDMTHPYVWHDIHSHVWHDTYLLATRLFCYLTLIVVVSSSPRKTFQKSLTNTKKSYTHKKETSINSRQPCTHWNTPYTHSKEPYIHSKEPYIHSKEPYIHSKEPYIHLKERCDSFICATWFLHMCGKTHPHVRYDSFICATYVWHDSFICAT